MQNGVTRQAFNLESWSSRVKANIAGRSADKDMSISYLQFAHWLTLGYSHIDNLATVLSYMESSQRR